MGRKEWQAAELIAHLESWGILVKGDPDHMAFLALDTCARSGKRYVRRFGWGSALGTDEQWLCGVVLEPSLWIPTEERGETLREALG
jgi:hypothetical protein